MTPIERKARGSRAANLLNDDMLQEALREVGYSAHRAFESAKTEAELVLAREMLRGAEAFVRVLRLAVEHGSAAAKQIDRELAVNDGLVANLMRRTRNREDMPWTRKTAS